MKAEMRHFNEITLFPEHPLEAKVIKELLSCHLSKQFHIGGSHHIDNTLISFSIYWTDKKKSKPPAK